MSSDLLKQYDHMCKVVVVGDSGVGKSSLILRFAEGMFVMSHIATIGVDFRIRTVEDSGKVIKMQLWDTAGQERFRAIMPTYYRGAHAVMLVFDVTQQESLDALQSRWLKDVRLSASDDAMLVVIGNKADGPSLQHKETTAAGRAFADSIGAVYMETSAKTGRNVDEAFLAIAQQFSDAIISKQVAESQPLIASASKKAKSSTIVLRRGKSSPSASCACL